jgi:para-nitrobenzyl esterase
MTKDTKGLPANRRDVIAGATLAAVATTASAQTRSRTPPRPPVATEAPAAPRANILGGGASGQIFWTVQTTSGRVEGIANGKVKCFKGIPYGAPTGGLNRFMPPKPALAWKGVKNCIGYTPICPQTPSDYAVDYGMMIGWDRHVGPGGMDEDCLSVNVWTPNVNDGARKPVLVSFHGGGWTTGSGNGPMYDGGQMARLGDVVVVTVNHRLGVYGYTHGVAPDSGNVGLLDMVASLKWVKENIEKFGGDPSRVFIFGQSGGGSKVSTLLATPSAKGLFSRAAVQSGSSLTSATAEQAALETDKLLKALGLTRKNMADIHKVSWQKLLEAQTTSGASFRPVVGGAALPHQMFDPTAPLESADVPVIISTTLHDAALRLSNFDLTQDGCIALFNQRWPGKGADIYNTYKKANPKLTPFLVQAEAFTDATRGGSQTQALRKSQLNKAPAYMYVWDWATPAFDGKFGAVHGHDVDASLHLYRNPIAGAGMAEGRMMSDRLAGAWVAFATTGNPNHSLIPNWPAYEERNKATMVFDKQMSIQNDYRGDMVRMLAAAAGPGRRG